MLALFTVSSIADSGPGSLREAVALANANPGPDLIDFEPVIQIIQLQTQLEITDSVTIDATGVPDGVFLDLSAADATPSVVDGQGICAFHIDDGDATSDQEITLRGLTISHGDVSGRGGAIDSRESLAIEGVTISHNAAAVNGGGINLSSPGFQSDPFVTVVNSFIENNSTGWYGGGLMISSASLEMRSSVVSGNSAGSDGGGMHAYLFDVGFEITDSTFTDNSSAGYGGGLAIRSLAPNQGINDLTMPAPTSHRIRPALVAASFCDLPIMI